jgi:hypothetical protein
MCAKNYSCPKTNLPFFTGYDIFNGIVKYGHDLRSFLIPNFNDVASDAPHTHVTITVFSKRHLQRKKTFE